MTPTRPERSHTAGAAASSALNAQNGIETRSIESREARGFDVIQSSPAEADERRRARISQAARARIGATSTFVTFVIGEFFLGALPTGLHNWWERSRRRALIVGALGKVHQVRELLSCERPGAAFDRLTLFSVVCVCVLESSSNQSTGTLIIENANGEWIKGPLRRPNIIGFRTDLMCSFVRS